MPCSAKSKNTTRGAEGTSQRNTPQPQTTPRVCLVRVSVVYIQPDSPRHPTQLDYREHLPAPHRPSGTHCLTSHILTPQHVAHTTPSTEKLLRIICIQKATGLPRASPWRGGRVKSANAAAHKACHIDSKQQHRSSRTAA